MLSAIHLEVVSVVRSGQGLTVRHTLELVISDVRKDAMDRRMLTVLLVLIMPKVRQDDVFASSSGTLCLTVLCGVEGALRHVSDVVDWVKWSATCVANMQFAVRMEFVAAFLIGTTKAHAVSTLVSVLPSAVMGSALDRVVKTAASARLIRSVMSKGNVSVSSTGVRLAASSIWVAAITAVSGVLGLPTEIVSTVLETV
jgi:hypothetical protein